MRNDASFRHDALCALLILALVPMVLLACNNSSFFSTMSEKGSSLVIAPASAAVPVNGSLAFSASGGVPPYVFSVASGPGSINSSTGVYLATTTAGPVTVLVTDYQQATATASLNVTASMGPLSLSPSNMSLNVGGSVTFVAAGGTPPYNYSITTKGSGSPTIDTSTGTYVAGFSVGNDVVTVTDGASPPATKTATVNVTTAVTGVNYGILMQTLPSTGTGATALSPGYNFTIQNGGSAGGTQTISWWVFLSPTATPGSGTVLLANGTTAALTAGGSSTIPLSWTWPSVPPVLPGVTRYLYILISAADDLTTSNNSYGSSAIIVAPPDIDYTVTSVTSTGGTVAGTGISANFVLSNGGSANGSQNVSWTAYISADPTPTLDAGARVIDSGTTGPLSAMASRTVSFTGVWPATVGTWYLKVAVAAADEVDATNNVQVSPAYGTTYVDYWVPSQTLPSSGTGGTTLPAGYSFVIQNKGSAAGTQTVNWSVFLSPTPGLGSGSVLLASSTTAGLAASGGSVTIPLSWTWPAVPPVLPGATRYFYILLSAADDLITTNNSYTSGAIVVAPPNVNYRVTSVASTGGTVAGTAISGTFILYNGGSANGSQSVSWTAYVSADSSATIDAGAKVIDSGTTGPLAALSSQSVPFSGVWPSTVGTWYLKVAVTAADDVDTTNNVQVSPPYITTCVDYTVTQVLTTIPQFAGGTASGSLTVQNVGSANGTQTVSWTVSVSTSPTPGAGSVVIASGTTGPLAAGMPATVPFSGVWPTTPGTYYLFATVTAADDVKPTNNLVAAGTVSVNAANVDYAVSSVTYIGGSLDPGGAVNGKFQLSNIGPNNGTQYVVWQVYASTTTTITSSSTLVASGVIAPLAAGAPASIISFSGAWPLTYGNYYLVATASVPVDVDVNTVNNTAATAGTTAVGYYNAAAFEPGNNAIGTAPMLITLKPGMTIYVTGNLSTSDLTDILGFNTGTLIPGSSTITFAMRWGPSVGMVITVYDVSGFDLQDVNQPPWYTLSMNWAVDAAATLRYISMVAQAAPGPYTLIISAN